MKEKIRPRLREEYSDQLLSFVNRTKKEFEILTELLQQKPLDEKRLCKAVGRFLHKKIPWFYIEALLLDAICRGQFPPDEDKAPSNNAGKRDIHS